MAINYGANYTGIDKERYDAGNQFYSQDRFLQGTGLDKPAITFNPSRSNTGIMSNYNPYPIIPMYDSGGDGGGGGPFGGIDKGVTADASAAGGYSLNPDGTAFNSPEVEEELAANRRSQTLTNLRNFGMFALNPMGFAIGKGLGYLKDKFFGGNDGDGGGGGGGVPDNVTAAGGSYTGGYHGAEGGFENTSSDGNTSTNNSQEDQGEVTAAEGGRIGYNGGGVTNYKNFLVKKGYKDMMQGMSDNEIRGLYDSVMGTFSLRRAYGGIVGMYR